MKKTTLRHLKKGLLAFASVVLLTPAVHAQTITTALDDLIIGFHAVGSPGQTLNLEVDLGGMSNFYNATPGSTIPLPALAVQDLIDTYGTSWNTRTDLFWGAVSTTGRASGTADGHAVVGTLWASAPDGQTAFNRGSVFAQKAASPTIEAMVVPPAAGALYGATSTSNSAFAAVIDASLSGSWSSEDLKTSGTSFGYFNPTVDNGADIPPGGQVLSELYELQPTNTSGVAGTLLGYLILKQNGLSFQAAGGVAAPVAGFSASPTNGAAPLVVLFTDASTGTITNRSWSFGDGGTSSATSPSHTYTNAGVYSVSLQVSGPGGANTLTSNELITATSTNIPPDTTPPALAIVSPTDYQVFTSASVVLTGTVSDASGILSVKVNGNSATVTSGAWYDQVTLALGTNALTVIATDNSLNANTATQIVHAVLAPLPAPVAGFSASPTNGAAPLVVLFTDASTGTITNRAWTFGDGAISSAISPSHTYTNAGVFSVSLKVAGPGGSNTLTRSSLITVTSTNVPPDTTPPTLAIVSPTDYQVFTSASIVLTGTVSDASGILSVKVNGSSATVTSGAWYDQVTLALGTNALTVIATDNSLNANTATQIVHAVLAPIPAPVAGFSASPTNGAAPLVVLFTDASTGTITNRAWTFGDGAISSAISPSHTYTNAGVFSVSLKVAGPGGSNTLTRSSLITVTSTNVPPDTTPPTLAIVSPTDYQVFTSASVVLTGTVSDTSGILSVKVNGSAATVTGNNWNDQVTLALGTNALTVIATDNSLNANTATQIVHAVLAPLPAPVAGFSASPTNGAAPLVVLFTDASTGTITNRAWTFGDGAVSSATSPSHTYTNAGVFSVSLKVAGPGGSNTLTRSSLITVTSTNVPPDTTPPTLAIVSPTDYQVFTSASIVLTGTVSDASGILSVKVNGSAATVTSGAWYDQVTLALGTNALTVIATDNSLNANTATQIVHAVLAPLPAPVAGFSASPTNGAAPLVVLFTDASTGTITNRAWTFGDGAVSSATSPSHTYTNAGVFSVSLKVAGPDGSNTLTRSSLITVTSTNIPPDTTPPTLTIVSPTNYQTFTNASLVVSGSASDAHGIKSVAVNGTVASLVGSNWFANVILVQGTNILSVIATDNSTALNTATQTVHAVLAVTGTNRGPVIVSAPIVVNAALCVPTTCVVIAGETNQFSVEASDHSGNPLSYQWSFGDGTTSGLSSHQTAEHAYAGTNCGPRYASVTVSDGNVSVTSNLTVTVACDLTINQLFLAPDFGRPNADSCYLSATLDLGPDYTPFHPAGLILTVDIGQALVSFTLDRNGHGTTIQKIPPMVATCQLTYIEPTRHSSGLWTLTITMNRGAWHDNWREYGLIDETFKGLGNRVTVPVIVVVGDEAFAAEHQFNYKGPRGRVDLKK